MTRHPIQAALPAGADDVLSAARGTLDNAPPNAFMVIHRLLRGRYVLTVVLAAIGAAAGAMTGYLATRPKFETRGMISIQPVIPRVIYEAPEQAPMHLFTNFVNRQATLIKSARVIALAVESEDWRALGRGTGPAAEDLLRRRVKAEKAPDTDELIEVTVTDEDSAFTSTAVRVVLRAYESLHGNEGSIDAEIIRKVEEQRDQLIREIANIESAVRTAAQNAGFGTEDLSSLHSARLLRIMGLEAQVDDLALRLRMAGRLDAPGSGPTAGGTRTPPAGDPVPAPGADRPLSPMIIATMDPEMRRLRTYESDIEAEITRLRAEGYLEKHSAVRLARSKLAGVQASIKKLADEWNATRSLGAPETGGSMVESLDAMEARYRILEGDLEAKKKELTKIDEARARLASLTRELEFKRDGLKAINERHRVLTVEAAGPEKTRGRISILSEGHTPSVPTVDKRKLFAAAGFVMGGGLPVGLMLLLGFIDRRFRYSDEAGQITESPALLGILPVLPPDLEDPEQRAYAAHCVHQIRMLLQIGGAASGEAGRKIYAITSPTPGDGKTSLALSLGLSFSAAGSRTLLIDFDMIGTGLTSSLRVDNGHSLADALRSGDASGGQVVVASDRLWVIPSRRGDDHFVSRLSSDLVRRLLGQVRDAYDVVIIDTGPMLGSLEASLVCAEADGVVMVVGRGQQREYVERAFARVRDVGGRLVGMVFNRATPGDFRRSVSSTSMRSIPRALPAPEWGHRPSTDRLGDSGPVVRTVALELDAEAEAESRSEAHPRVGPGPSRADSPVSD